MDTDKHGLRRIKCASEKSSQKTKISSFSGTGRPAAATEWTADGPRPQHVVKPRLVPHAKDAEMQKLERLWRAKPAAKNSPAA
jgi:hypothetical protein